MTPQDSQRLDELREIYGEQVRRAKALDIAGVRPDHAMGYDPRRCEGVFFLKIIDELIASKTEARK
jgi:hypothetical protein